MTVGEHQVSKTRRIKVMSYQVLEWPDGKNYADQDNLVIEMFDLVMDEIARAIRDG